MKLSCVVSSYDRPADLAVCLGSLRLQRHIGSRELYPVEIVVTDNSPAEINRRVAEQFQVIYLPTHTACPYSAAELGVEVATGEYVCFPSDDNYYVPEFAARMMRMADNQQLDFVHCDMLYDPRMGGNYAPIPTSLQVGGIDKGGFCLRRSLFQSIGGFPGKTGGASCSDGLLAEAIAPICRHARLPELLWFHG